jgi:hypothetical protein
LLTHDDRRLLHDLPNDPLGRRRLYDLLNDPLRRPCFNCGDLCPDAAELVVELLERLSDVVGQLFNDRLVLDDLWLRRWQRRPGRELLDGEQAVAQLFDAVVQFVEQFVILPTGGLGQLLEERERR